MVAYPALPEIELADEAISAHIGGRIRLARVSAGLRQERCGELCGVSFQQWQKYENGTNRIALAKLARLAVATGRPIDWFLGDVIDGERAGTIDRLASDPAFHQLINLWDTMDKAKRPAMGRLLQAFNELIQELTVKR